MRRVILFCLFMPTAFIVKAQSHISTGKYACQLVPKSRGYEKYTCPACAKIDEQKRLAKIAEEKRIKDAALQKPKAATTNTSSNDKVTEVGLAASSDPAPTPVSVVNNPLASYNSQYPAGSPTQVYVSSAVSLLSNLLAGDGSGYLKRQAARDWKERNNKETGERLDAAELRFKDVFLPLLKQAEEGDENSRLVLYFASERLYQKMKVPNREKWLEEAIAKDNIDALLEKARLEGGALNASTLNRKPPHFKKKSIPYLEKAAALGSVDALVILGLYYDHNDSSKDKNAVDYFKRAADLGSPNAMYYLGMIYRYGYTTTYLPDQKDRKYYPEKNEGIAKEWFKKAMLPDYQESLYARSLLHNQEFYGAACSFYECKAEKEFLMISVGGKLMLDGYGREKTANCSYESRNIQKIK